MAKMAARRREVFCPAIFLLFIFISFTTRKESFCQPDEISSKGITNGVNESFSFSSMFVENQKRYIRYSKKSLLCLLLLVCGDISPNPGPQPSPSLKRFTRKRGFKILHQNMNGISEKIDSVRGILQHKNIQILLYPKWCKLREEKKPWIKRNLHRNKLKQLVKQPTRITETSKTLIDIICTNNERTASDTRAR